MQDLQINYFQSEDGARSCAIFSKDMKYRYQLRRIWDHSVSSKRIVFVMLNPSTADEVKNDPTVERCQRRAETMGFGSLEVVNIFALRSTDPALLYKHGDPIGERNDEMIQAGCWMADLIVCAWGSHGDHQGRGEHVLKIIQALGKTPHTLGFTKGGQPKHPLYIPYETKPIPFMLPNPALWNRSLLL